VLIQWHRQDPVSEKEIKRADAVSNFQHNRNPFIDYPYLAEYIWGERAGQLLDMSHLISSSDPRFVVGESNGWIENTTGIDAATVSTTGKPSFKKVTVNGRLYIIVGKKSYSVTGQQTSFTKNKR